ncbi:hypothetical protein RFI_12081 [Reticulomyxa filosa]|uniref:Uncharacterized protein n=1 Tax=Reticulomyxa filosa TaxID=46433 RepID=X6NI81_RETFI|nr:hypothetical protein RFI_12081 [Reticulomyxa filosa]|eukprot:ETO25062.1 hypothetical protein RFI_12081 [Reticulomyxa filosa]
MPMSTPTEMQMLATIHTHPGMEKTEMSLELAPSERKATMETSGHRGTSIDQNETMDQGHHSGEGYANAENGANDTDADTRIERASSLPNVVLSAKQREKDANPLAMSNDKELRLLLEANFQGAISTESGLDLNTVLSLMTVNASTPQTPGGPEKEKNTTTVEKGIELAATTTTTTTTTTTVTTTAAATDSKVEEPPKTTNEQTKVSADSKIASSSAIDASSSTPASADPHQPLTSLHSYYKTLAQQAQQQQAELDPKLPKVLSIGGDSGVPVNVSALHSLYENQNLGTKDADKPRSRTHDQVEYNPPSKPRTMTGEAPGKPLPTRAVAVSETSGQAHNSKVKDKEHNDAANREEKKDKADDGGSGKITKQGSDKKKSGDGKKGSKAKNKSNSDTLVEAKEKRVAKTTDDLKSSDKSKKQSKTGAAKTPTKKNKDQTAKGSKSATKSSDTNKAGSLTLIKQSNPNKGAQSKATKTNNNNNNNNNRKRTTQSAACKKKNQNTRTQHKEKQKTKDSMGSQKKPKPASAKKPTTPVQKNAKIARTGTAKAASGTAKKSAGTKQRSPRPEPKDKKPVPKPKKKVAKGSRVKRLQRKFETWDDDTDANEDSSEDEDFDFLAALDEGKDADEPEQRPKPKPKTKIIPKKPIKPKLKPLPKLEAHTDTKDDNKPKDKPEEAVATVVPKVEVAVNREQVPQHNLIHKVDLISVNSASDSAMAANVSVKDLQDQSALSLPNTDNTGDDKGESNNDNNNDETGDDVEQEQGDIQETDDSGQKKKKKKKRTRQFVSYVYLVLYVFLCSDLFIRVTPYLLIVVSLESSLLSFMIFVGFTLFLAVFESFMCYYFCLKKEVFGLNRFQLTMRYGVVGIISCCYLLLACIGLRFLPRTVIFRKDYLQKIVHNFLSVCNRHYKGLFIEHLLRTAFSVLVIIVLMVLQEFYWGWNFYTTLYVYAGAQVANWVCIGIMYIHMDR